MAGIQRQRDTFPLVMANTWSVESLDEAGDLVTRSYKADDFDHAEAQAKEAFPEEEFIDARPMGGGSNA